MLLHKNVDMVNLLLFWAVGLCAAYASPLQIVGPTGGYGRLHVNTRTPGRLLFFSQQGNLYQSLDSGQSWSLRRQNGTTSNFPGSSYPEYYRFDHDPVIYHWVGNPPRKSIDGGVNWSDLALDVYPNCFDVHPLDSQFIVAVDTSQDQGGLTAYTSHDGGEHFDAVELDTAQYVFSPFVNIASGSTQQIDILGNTSAGVRYFRSTDGGQTWTRKDYPVISLLIDVAFTDGEGVDAYLGCKRAPDSQEQGGYYAIDFDSEEEPVWRAVPVLMAPWVRINPFDANRVAALGFVADTYWRTLLVQSQNGGQSWAQPENDWNGVLRDYVFDPHQPGRIYAASEEGLWRWDNAQTGWTSITQGIPEGQVISAAAADGEMLAIGPLLRIHKSTDGGQNWTKAFDDPTTTGLHEIVMNPADPKRLIALEQNAIFPDNHVLITFIGEGSDISYKLLCSADGGASWQAQDFAAQIKWTRLHPDAVNGQSVCSIGSSVGSMGRPGQQLYMTRTTDAGESWTTPTLVFSGATTVGVDILAAPRDPLTLYAAGLIYESNMLNDSMADLRFGSSLVLRRSADGGVTWEGMNTSFGDMGNYTTVTALEVDPLDAAHVYVATGGGLFESHDRGGHWEALRSQEEPVFDLIIDPAGRRLYAAGHDTLWRLSLDTGLGDAIYTPAPTLQTRRTIFIERMMWNYFHFYYEWPRLTIDAPRRILYLSGREHNLTALSLDQGNSANQWNMYP